MAIRARHSALLAVTLLGAVTAPPALAAGTPSAAARRGPRSRPDRSLPL